MTLEEMVIGAARFLGSLPILRWAFVGAIIAIVVDFSDLFMMNLFELGGLRNYQAFDKWLDLIYMLTFLIVALRWSGVVRSISVGLFVFRIVGVAIFELSGWREVLIFFPNAFEFWVVFAAGMRRFRPAYELTLYRSILFMVPLLVIKEFQEYVLHWGKWLDDYVAMEVAESLWIWFGDLF